ncbi:MAG: hypothetical protein JXR60_11750 [Bacteroidales bacterium]|nr:hypothetical protein [Bacteroidales bacterium]
MDKNTAKSRLFDLYQIAVADQTVKTNEYQFLIDIAKSLELSENDVIDLMEGHLEFTITKPISYEDRMQHLFQLLFLMKIDGEIHQEEIIRIKNIALHLGLNLMLTDELIALIIKFKNDLVPEKEMLAQIKKHLN